MWHCTNTLPEPKVVNLHMRSDSSRTCYTTVVRFIVLVAVLVDDLHSSHAFHLNGLVVGYYKSRPSMVSLSPGGRRLSKYPETKSTFCSRFNAGSFLCRICCTCVGTGAKPTGLCRVTDEPARQRTIYRRSRRFVLTAPFTPFRRRNPQLVQRINIDPFVKSPATSPVKRLKIHLSVIPAQFVKQTGRGIIGFMSECNICSVP